VVRTRFVARVKRTRFVARVKQNDFNDLYDYRIVAFGLWITPDRTATDQGKKHRIAPDALFWSSEKNRFRQSGEIALKGHRARWTA